MATAPPAREALRPHLLAGHPTQLSPGSRPRRTTEAGGEHLLLQLVSGRGVARSAVCAYVGSSSPAARHVLHALTSPLSTRRRASCAPPCNSRHRLSLRQVHGPWCTIRRTPASTVQPASMPRRRSACSASSRVWSASRSSAPSVSRTRYSCHTSHASTTLSLPMWSSSRPLRSTPDPLMCTNIVGCADAPTPSQRRPVSSNSECVPPNVDAHDPAV
jgi:hypothetical protein